MPIYEYQCTKCEHRLEALQKISDSPLVECPQCHESSLKKLVSAASFRLKGGGWYETDFKTGNKKQLADSDSASKTGSESGNSGSTDKGTGADKSTGSSKSASSKSGDSKGVGSSNKSSASSSD